MSGTAWSSTTCSTCRSAPGRRFVGDTGGIVGKLISGWSVNGVTTLQAGFPLAFTATPNLIGSGYGLRPNVDPNCDKQCRGSAIDRLNQWFNTACFSVPNAGVRRRESVERPAAALGPRQRAARPTPICAHTASTTGTSPSRRRRASAAA